MLLILIASFIGCSLSFSEIPVQYHIQTDEGPDRYFRYQTYNGQYRNEKRYDDGKVVGTYGWVDDEGLLRLYDYVADDQGYRVVKTRTRQVSNPQLEKVREEQQRRSSAQNLQRTPAQNSVFLRQSSQSQSQSTFGHNQRQPTQSRRRFNSPNVFSQTNNVRRANNPPNTSPNLQTNAFSLPNNEFRAQSRAFVPQGNRRSIKNSPLVSSSAISHRNGVKPRPLIANINQFSPSAQRRSQFNNNFGIQSPFNANIPQRPTQFNSNPSGQRPSQINNNPSRPTQNDQKTPEFINSKIHPNLLQPPNNSFQSTNNKTPGNVNFPNRPPRFPSRGVNSGNVRPTRSRNPITQQSSFVPSSKAAPRRKSVQNVKNRELPPEFDMDRPGGRTTIDFDLGNQYRKEKVFPDGTVVGEHGYVDPFGILRITHYMSDDDGHKEAKRSFWVGTRSRS